MPPVPPEGFIIYGTPKGYVAVTNPVRQRILKLLEGGERSLSELMQSTGKAKSTLSAVHLRDLLRNGLIEERIHSEDSRVKVYRLVARRIGTSTLPLDDLRQAVVKYVSSSQSALALPLAKIVDAFDHLPTMPPGEGQWISLVGERIGTLSAPHLQAEGPAPVLRELGEVWRREGLGTVVKVKADASSIQLSHSADARPGGARCAFLKGFLQGALTTRSGRAAWVEEESCGGKSRTQRCVFRVAWPSG